MKTDWTLRLISDLCNLIFCGVLGEWCTYANASNTTRRADSVWQSAATSIDIRGHVSSPTESNLKQTAGKSNWKEVVGVGQARDLLCVFVSLFVSL